MRIVDVRLERTEDVVEYAAGVVFSGGTLLYPDETGYVFACDPEHARAAAHVYDIAEHQVQRLVLSVASTTELLEYAPENPLAMLAAKRLLPGPLTLLLRTPPSLRGAESAFGERAGFRVPADPLARALLERCGPLIGSLTSYTGADLDGLPRVDLLLERGETARVEPSVVDVTGEHPRLLREGAVSLERLATGLGPMERAGTTPKMEA